MLRVIAGIAKGHKLKTVSGNTTRPTTDKVKGSLFNIIASKVAGSNVLDIFAGTGNLGIEALSRGANHAVFIDKSHECCKIISENLEHTGFLQNARVICGNTDIVLAGLKDISFDIIMMDPPYSKNLVEKTIDNLLKNDIIKKNSMIIAEHYVKDALPESFGDLVLSDRRRYGDTCMSFYLFQ